MKKALIPLLLSLGCATAPKPTPPPPEPASKPAAAPAPKRALAAPVKEEVKDDIDALLKGLAVHFDFDRADLTPDSRGRLDGLAERMRKSPAVHIKVAGNCDELGTEEYNLALGQKRADAVKEYLSKLGVDPARVDTVSFGEEKPLDSAHTPEAWSANRRGDIQRAN
jgi:peptidoglycan-associated lipoprotein